MALPRAVRRQRRYRRPIPSRLTSGSAILGSMRHPVMTRVLVVIWTCFAVEAKSCAAPNPRHCFYDYGLSRFRLKRVEAACRRYTRSVSAYCEVGGRPA